MASRPGDGVDQVARRISNNLVKPVLGQAAEVIGSAMSAVYRPAGHGTHKKHGYPGPPYVIQYDVKKAKAANEVRLLVGPPKEKFYLYFQDAGYNRGGRVVRSRAGGKSVTRHFGPGVKHIPGTHELSTAAKAIHSRVEQLLRDGLAEALSKTVKGT